MDIILLFLAKPLDKHGITQVLINHPRLGFLWLHRPFKHRKKHDSQEAYFVNGQALAVYLKMFKIFLSKIRILNAFKLVFNTI